MATLFLPLKLGIKVASVVVVSVVVRESRAVCHLFQSVTYALLACFFCMTALSMLERALHIQNRASLTANMVVHCETCCLTSCTLLFSLHSSVVDVGDDALFR